jgi:hypothetical protein
MGPAAAIEIDSELDAFNGRRRQRRLFVRVAVAVLVTFGGLFAALAQSYTHAHP